MTTNEYLVINTKEFHKAMTWWDECCSRNIVYIIVTRYRTKADVHWDTYSLSPTVDHDIKDSPYLDGFFQALLEFKSTRKNDFVYNQAGLLHRLPMADAEKIAQTLAFIFKNSLKNISIAPPIREHYKKPSNSMKMAIKGSTPATHGSFLALPIGGYKYCSQHREIGVKFYCHIGGVAIAFPIAGIGTQSAC